LGMREMQEKAYHVRDAQYILIKSPPASGKSRALMFIALDKLVNQGIKKIIVAVPEKSIGGSFVQTNLKDFGFFANWFLMGGLGLLAVFLMIWLRRILDLERNPAIAE